MPLNTTADDAPTKFPTPDFLTLGNFKRGVITLVNPAKVPKNALVLADNVFLVEDGQPSPRPGVQWYGTAPSANSMDGFDYFETGGVIHLVACAGGIVYRSLNDGLTWTTCTGYTMTAGKEVWMEQYNSFLYITNGIDIIVRYDGSTTLQTYTVLSTPSAPSAAITGLSGNSYNYYYKISAVSAVGFSAASAAAGVNVGQDRTNWDSTTNYITLTCPAPQSTQTRYDIYISIDNLNFYYLDSIASSATSPTVTYKDDGTAIQIPSTIAPITNTTQGPTVQQLVTVATRLYGVRDPNNPQRIWFTSGSSPLGSFSSGYDGGYLDWQLGGKYTTTMVADYRDGKGDSIATVWMDSADGQGCIIQMSLGILTVGNLSVTVPSAYRLPGSRGTPAPGSVVNVLNDYMFYNTQAFYNLGNRPNLLQILSTDEASANIRPTVKTITPGSANNIASLYYDAKVYFSVNYNSTVNNYTAIFDTELQAWMPTAYTIGFKQFLRYTDSNNVHHLLGLKPNDNRLTELGTLYSSSQLIQGDYGQSITTNLLTGVYATEKDRYDFQYVAEMEYEFSQPNGIINIELLGYDHALGFTSVNTAVFDVTGGSVNTTGWDTFGWDLDPWDNTSVAPNVISEATSKRYSIVQAELNTIQWHIFTNTLTTAYVLRTLQTWGTDTDDAHPTTWQITGTNG